MSELYFAYGKYVNEQEIRRKYPAAEKIGPVTADGYKLDFASNSRGYGVATISPQESASVCGVLWRMDSYQMEALEHEQNPDVFEKVEITVQEINDEGTPFSVQTHILKEPYRNVPAMPAQTYYNKLIIGYAENELPTEAVNKAVDRVGRHMKEKGILNMINPGTPQSRSRNQNQAR